jgi:PadR family transcriptional regulator, regulatory protein AphA
MQRQRVPPLRGALLGLVARGPSSGYELTKVFDATLNNVWATTHSAIYPELVAMEGDGLIAITDRGPRGRKRYSLTAKGKETLNDWLESPVGRATPRNEAQLRMFFLGLMTPDAAEAFLRDELSHHEERLLEYREDQARDRPDVPAWWTGGVMLEAGVRYEQMMVQWLEWALEQLSRSPIRQEKPVVYPARKKQIRTRRSSQQRVRRS